MLSELELARTDVQAAAGNPDRLDVALENLEQIFTRLTGVAATRAEGKMYAGKTLVYEDSRRDAEVLLGRDFLEASASLSHCCLSVHAGSHRGWPRYMKTN